MTYSELLPKIPFEDVVPCMTFIRGNQDIILREHSELDIRLQSVKPKASDRHIVVASRWEGTSPDIDMICTVRDRYDKSWCIIGRYTSLNELIGMDVDVEENVTLSEEELVVGFLWELSKCHLDDNDTDHLAIREAWELKIVLYVA